MDGRLLSFEDPLWTQLRTGFDAPFRHLHLLREFEARPLKRCPELDGLLRSLGTHLCNQGDLGQIEYAVHPWICKFLNQCDAWSPLAVAVLLDIEYCREFNDPPIEAIHAGYEASVKQIYPLALRLFSPSTATHRDSCLLGSAALLAMGKPQLGRQLLDAV